MVYIKHNMWFYSNHKTIELWNYTYVYTYYSYILIKICIAILFDQRTRLKITLYNILIWNVRTRSNYYKYIVIFYSHLIYYFKYAIDCFDQIFIVTTFYDKHAKSNTHILQWCNLKCTLLIETKHSLKKKKKKKYIYIYIYK